MYKKRWKREIPFHLMIFPAFLLLLIFSYLPMAGIAIAFQKFIPAKGLFGDQKWIGLDNFKYVFDIPNFRGIIWNTVIISLLKIVVGMLVSLTVAILVNELKHHALRRSIQTVIYLPHFLSWVVLGGIFIDILSPSGGLVNKGLQAFGLNPVFFLGDNRWFPFTAVATETWKEFGYGTIIYLASITGIDPTLYEAAQIDGAGRWQQILKVTLPGIKMVIVLLMVLNMGNLLNAGFDQIFNIYSPPVYQSGDIIDTFVYRIGLLDSQFGVATAIGLFKSVVSLTFISAAYYIAYRFADYKIF